MKISLLPSLSGVAMTLALSVSPLALAAQTAPETPAAFCAEVAGMPDAGVPVSPEAQDAVQAALAEAAPYCEQALEEGSEDPVVLFHIGAIRQADGDHEEAIAAFEAAAAAGLAAANTKLGDYHLFGIGPLRRDADEAVGYFTAAAEGGDPAGQMTLGLLHRIGAGVPRDTGRMVELMRAAADGGYHFAQYRLGQTYLTGDGIPGGADATLGIPNRDEAARYLSMAAEQGNIEAVLDLARIYSELDGPGTGDAAQQFRWTERAVEAGLPDAVAALGFLYERGRGVEADPDRAAALYVQALETGEVDVDDLRGRIGGYEPPWDRATAIAFQVILQDRGLYLGAIDGIIGPMSRAAAAALDD
jgi:TPR repeat protein